MFTTGGRRRGWEVGGQRRVSAQTRRDAVSIHLLTAGWISPLISFVFQRAHLHTAQGKKKKKEWRKDMKTNSGVNEIVSFI